MRPQQRIAHYLITGKLGEGGMGEVWRATDTKLNRDVAIKILPDPFAQDTERMARFTREAHVLAALNHPNISAVYGVEDRALIMEFVDGQPLQGPLPLETALDYARQIADAVEAAHEKGVVHRDLKPANILVTTTGVVKVLDFGLAKVAEQRGDDTTVTMSPSRAGVILGTPAYMSTGMIPDPSITSNAMHNGPSWYDWSLIGTGHVATNQSDEVESHFDTFSPIFLTPLHFLFDVLPSFFINPKPGVQGPTYTCSPGVGCH